jgi:hypothetical protein
LDLFSGVQLATVILGTRASYKHMAHYSEA